MMSGREETNRLNRTTNMESSLQRYTSPVDITVEMVGLTSKTRTTKPWSRNSYDVVCKASVNQRGISVVEEEGEKEIDGAMMTPCRRVPRWCVRVVLLVVTLLIAAILMTLSVIPMARLETMTTAPIKSTSNPTSIFSDKNDESSCLLGEFRCGTQHDLSECIPVEWLCDGAVDCTTGRDEKYCEDVTSTAIAIQPRPCVAWQQTFNESCKRPSVSVAGCEYIPQCQADGSGWTGLQCTVDRRTCWCVDETDGTTKPRTFAGVDVLIDGGIPNCQ